MHYTRWKRHGSVQPTRRYFREPHPARDGHKWCSLCEQELPASEFWAQSNKADGLATRCRNCLADLKRADNYGLSGADYLALLERQENLCAACHQPETARHQSGRIRRLAVDHNHACCPGKASCGKCIRALLCARCNSILGQANDNADLLEALVSYLN